MEKVLKLYLNWEFIIFIIESKERNIKWKLNLKYVYDYENKKKYYIIRICVWNINVFRDKFNNRYFC